MKGEVMDDPMTLEEAKLRYIDILFEHFAERGCFRLIKDHPVPRKKVWKKVRDATTEDREYVDQCLRKRGLLEYLH
jgi:hypothetical protein